MTSFSYNILLLAGIISRGSIGEQWYSGKMRYSKENNEEFYEIWPNKNLWFHTDGHWISYTFIFLPCVSGSFLFPITSHVITSKSKSQKLPIERTRIEYLAWLFFGTLKVGQDKDDS